jgi:4'-phosphopantetheinyl transferase
MSLEPGGPARFLRGVHPSWRINSFMASNECPVALIYDGLPVGLKFFGLGNVYRLQ